MKSGYQQRAHHALPVPTVGSVIRVQVAVLPAPVVNPPLRSHATSRTDATELHIPKGQAMGGVGPTRSPFGATKCSPRRAQSPVRVIAPVEVGKDESEHSSEEDKAS